MTKREAEKAREILNLIEVQIADPKRITVRLFLGRGFAKAVAAAIKQGLPEVVEP